ncbi:hypothetical protein ILUMI_08338 [Ignelater luminosus]|uniref:Cytochrome P450 n=1 Tax=Ignelater luminosus TaxID=2038154 RepID=A0A8K0GDH9_IGNLU|nr:hypothetical protein ILUMI_08338 [Ignelater luminosus]
MIFFAESLLLDLSAVLVVLATTFIVFYKWCFSHWKSKGVFCLKPSIPFGNAGELVLQKRTIGLEFKHVYDEFKKRGLKYGGYYFFMRPLFVPVDLDLVKHIMAKDFAHFTDHVIHINEQSDPLSVHLFSLKGQKWKGLRAKLTPTFTSGKMRMMFQTLVDCSTGLVNVMDKFVMEKQAIDIKEIVGRFTTDIIGSCAFGIDCSSLKNPDSEFRQYGKKFFDTSVKDSIVRLLTLTAPEIFTVLRLSSHRKDVTNFFMNVVRQTVNYREENNIVRKDFMHLLLQLKNNVKITENDLGDLKSNKSDAEAALSMTELAAQCFVFFIAGFETSSTTSTFCLYELSKNTELQQNLRDEINRVLEKHNGKITYDAMMEMVYMDKCINETLRKYPPVPVHTRECTKTYNVPNSNVVLKKGSFVFIPVMGIQHDPEYFPDPDKFDPERFSEENKANRHSAAWTPFGDGPRACIGLRFGVMQTKVGLTVLLKNYKFTLNPRTASPLTLEPGSFVLAASTGVWLNAEKIS